MEREFTLWSENLPCGENLPWLTGGGGVCSQEVCQVAVDVWSEYSILGDC